MFPPVLELAPAKINLALHVLGRRNDGYHELDSIVAFADQCDTLLFEPSAETTLSITGPMAAGLSAGKDNLVLKAVSELGKHIPLPDMKITLNKILPVAAGMGGGSSDAAAALRGGLRASGRALSPEALYGIALSLGADVPVCLAGRTCHMQGKGDILTPMPDSNSAIVLVHPGGACSTAEVFASLGLKHGQKLGGALDPGEPRHWRNDLTGAAIRLQPVIAEVLAALRGIPGIESPRMSGSGATCFGLSADFEQASAAAAALARTHPGWWVRAARLS